MRFSLRLAVQDLTRPLILFRKTGGVLLQKDLLSALLPRDELNDQIMLVSVATESKVEHPVGIDF